MTSIKLSARKKDKIIASLRQELDDLKKNQQKAIDTLNTFWVPKAGMARLTLVRGSRGRFSKNI